MSDLAELEEDDASEDTRWDGSPHREKALSGRPGAFLTDEARDALVGHIAKLQQRLEVYEPAGKRHHHTGKVIDPGGDPALRAQVRSLEGRLAAVQSELRVAEDAIREHIRQKMALRRQLEEAHAGRGGRAGGPEDRRAEPVPAAAERPTVRAISAAPEGARSTAVVEPSGAAVAAERGAVERPLVAPPAPAPAPADATVRGINRPRTTEGWFYHALKRLGGERTVRELAEADGRTIAAAGIKAAWTKQRGLVETCGQRGIALLYRLKA